MTRAVFARGSLPDGRVRLRLAVSGHAGYAPKGQDIVCAAASILAEALADALEQQADPPTLRVRCNRQDGLVILTADCAAQQLAQVQGLFDTALAGYRLLAQHYPAHVAFCAKNETESCRRNGGLYNE